MKKILTYGTFDLLHYGHIELLKRAKELGDMLYVGLSTDEFNDIKGKKSYYHYDKRKELLEAIRYVDFIFKEEVWEQKIEDIKKYNIDILVMGDDWKDSERFEHLKKHCKIIYLSRTEGISSTEIKNILK